MTLPRIRGDLVVDGMMMPPSPFHAMTLQDPVQAPGVTPVAPPINGMIPSSASMP